MRVGTPDYFFPTDDKDRSGLHCDSDKSGSRDVSHGVRTDRRQVDTPFLTGFRDFYEHAAAPGPPLLPGPPDHGTCPLGSLNCQHMAALDHGGLTDIYCSESTRDGSSPGDVNAVLFVRLAPGPEAGRGQEFVHETVGPDDPESFTLEFIDDGA